MLHILRGLLFYLDSCTLTQVTSESCYGYYDILASLEDKDLGCFDSDSPSKKSMAGIKVAEAPAQTSWPSMDANASK